MANNFQCGRFEFDLERPLVMGIVNVTPTRFPMAASTPIPTARSPMRAN
ncbi:hypothetical protein L495_1534 [Bordetella bronchiseptica CARE970018BB]|nr:hypothetical protein L495_1534 [Bordetella bronchiseptica CARE970018BB]